MPTAEELIKMLNESSVDTYASEPEELVIDAESRSINIPQSERLFGVKGDMNIERKYFRCPKIVGDNIDLSTHQIFIAYVYTETESGSIFPSIGVAPYHCEDVEVDGEDITFSWKLTGNVFKNPGFILFKMYAKRTETDPNTVFNTTPAIGTVLATIPDGTEEIKEEYPDVIAQIFDRLDALESVGGGGTGGTTNYEKLSNKPKLNGVTLEGNKTLDQVGVLAKNQGSNNSGKFLSIGSDGNVVPADVPSGGTVDPEQIKQAVNGYLEENPVSGMTAEQEQQLNQNTTDVADLKSAVNNCILTDEIKQALLQIASKVAYIDADGQFYYDDLYYTLYPEIERPFEGSMYITIANETLKEGYIGDDGGLISNANSHLIDRTVRALPFALADNGILLDGMTLRSAYYDSEQRFLGRDYAHAQEHQPIKLVNNDYAVYEKVGWEGALNVSYVILLSEMNDSLFTNTNVSIDASGELSSDTQFQATDLIRIPNDCNKYVLLSAIHQINKIAFYNSSKTFISREYTGMNADNLSKYGDIPIDAVYYRASKRMGTTIYNMLMKEI